MSRNSAVGQHASEPALYKLDTRHALVWDRLEGHHQRLFETRIHTIHATTTTTTSSTAAEVEVKAEEAAETAAAAIVVCIKSNVCGYKTPPPLPPPTTTTRTTTQSSSSSPLSSSRRLEKSFEGFHKLCSHERRRVTESRVEKEGLRKEKGEKDLRSCFIRWVFERERKRSFLKKKKEQK